MRFTMFNNALGLPINFTPSWVTQFCVTDSLLDINTNLIRTPVQLSNNVLHL